MIFNKCFKKIKSFYQSQPWAPYLILFLLIFAIYGQSIFFDYSYLDDQHLILDNTDILARANIEEIFLNDVFFSVGNFYYRPLLTWSLVLDWHLGAGSIYFFHFTNLIYHFLAACLLFYLLRLSAVKKDSAFLLTLIFVTHPVLTQAVVWVPGRNDSLLAIFIFASLIFFNNFLEKESRRDLIFLWLSFLAALLTKETAIFLPPLALAWAFVFKREQLNRFKVLMISAGVLAVGFIWYLARRLVIDSNATYSLWQSVLDNLLAPFFFLAKVFWPFNLSVYAIASDISYWPGIIILLIILLLVYRQKFKNWPQVLFGFFWFYLLLLFSSLRPDGEAARNFMGHRLYLPMFGLLIILANLKLPGSWLKSRTLKILLVAGILFLIFLSFKHSFHFKDRFSFWQQAVSSSPSSALSHRNLGAMYYLEGDLDQAELLFKKSLELNEQELMANNNLGAIYLDRGNLDLAEHHLKAELEINPNYDIALFNLGRLYYQRKDYDQAVYFWEKTLRVNPRHYMAALSLQNLYEESR
jgi:tetratricopeptide (TPR) repeat protein